MGFGTCVDSVTQMRAVPKSPASKWKMDLALIDCFVAANNCDEMQACQHPTAAQEALCENVTSDVCSKNQLVTCSQKESSRLKAFDCGSVGLTCTVGESGDGTCGLGVCDASTAMPRCEGDLLISCSSQYGGFVSEDCRLIGQTCRTDATGQAACRSDVPCDPIFSDFRCDGTVRVACRNGSESRQDCALLGANYTCEATTYTSADGSSKQSSMSCVPANRECTTHDAESCNQGVISYCRLGRGATYDCRAAGFSGCTTVTTNSTTIATCVR